MVTAGHVTPCPAPRLPRVCSGSARTAPLALSLTAAPRCGAEGRPDTWLSGGEARPARWWQLPLTSALSRAPAALIHALNSSPRHLLPAGPPKKR